LEEDCHQDPEEGRESYPDDNIDCRVYSGHPDDTVFDKLSKIAEATKANRWVEFVDVEEGLAKGERGRHYY
jgi:predicted transcriptional regulator